MGNNAKVSTVAAGDLELSFSSRALILKDCLYVASIRRNLTSVSSLVRFGYYVYFNDFMVIRHNKHFICSCSLVDNLYIINQVTTMLQLSEMNNTTSLSSKRKEPSKMNQTYLWHLRLGHINLRRI